MPAIRSVAEMLSPAEYQTLAELRYQLARFLRRRRDAAQSAGLEPQQYELLLAVKGLPHGKLPTIKEVAAQLQLQHHSVVELADRLERRGLLERRPSERDRRFVLLSVTRRGQEALNRVVRYSFGHLRTEAPELVKTLGRILKAKARRS